MVEAGLIGKKAGRGFFDHGGKKSDQGKVNAEAEATTAKERRSDKKFSTEEITDRLILPMLLEATRVLEDGVAASARDVDLALIYGIGFPPFRGGLFFWADEFGTAAIVEKLKTYNSLGERFAPTRLLTSKSASGKKFYDN
jgi:3-hydroxyacyl-CoA dehydrogenase/enoyl-CoA hydratase/3-hydroxybutyryl-CoA epimerase/3-hydroxyacyl-CoA dehydrogenase/enoyl-CoA hydratase/3-hydroxybutyryl-CoA epimerase/enoyl-CoA isomerase